MPRKKEVLVLALETSSPVMSVALKKGDLVLEKKVAGLGLSAHVRFAGYIDEAEKVDHYRLADAFILLSRGEGFGIVLLEAAACGISLVASKADASCEALGNGEMSVLVDPKNPVETKSGILQALKPSNRDAVKGIHKFSYESFALRLRRLLNQTVNP